MNRKLLSGKMIMVLVVLLVFFMAVGVAEENELTDLELVWRNASIDASGQWMYILVDDGAMIIGCRDEPSGDLTVPDVMDGFIVNGIYAWAFHLCHYLTSITIPTTVTVIDIGLFMGCYSLESVTIPDGVTYIGDNAFTDCYSLTSVIIPNNVMHIGESAFDSSGLTSMTIPVGVTSIGKDAFAGCDDLTLTVTEGSYAEQYAKDNNIPYVLATE